MSVTEHPNGTTPPSANGPLRKGLIVFGMKPPRQSEDPPKKPEQELDQQLDATSGDPMEPTKKA